MQRPLVPPRTEGDGNDDRSPVFRAIRSEYTRWCLISHVSSRSLELPATIVGVLPRGSSSQRNKARTWDRVSTFKPSPCVGCLLNAPGADLQSEGHRHQDRTADAADAPQAPRRRERATTRVPSMAHGSLLHWLTERAAPKTGGQRLP